MLGIIPTQISRHFVVGVSDEEQCSLRPTLANAVRTTRSSYGQILSNRRPRSWHERLALDLADT